MLRSIAKSGLKGRPRQTRILFVALGLAFFFVTLSFLLLSTANLTREVKRRDTFGEWQSVYVNESPERARELATGNKVADVRMVGSDDKAGLVGGADDNFWEMSHIQLLEGRYPAALDEIVLEQGQLSYFAETPQVGDTLSMAVTIAYGEEEEDEATQIQSLYGIAVEIEQRYIHAMAENWDTVYANALQFNEEQKEYIPEYAKQAVGFKQSIGHETDYETELKILLEDNESQNQWIHSFFGDDPGTIEDRILKFRQYQSEIENQNLEHYLYDEEYRDSLRYMLDEDELDDFIYENYGPGSSTRALAEQIYWNSGTRASSELEGIEGTTLQTRQRFINTSIPDYFAHSILVGLGYHLPVNDYPDLSDIDVIMMKQEAVMIREMTLVGVIQDYRTVWDGPSSAYPNAFVTHETATLLLDKVLAKSKVPENKEHVAAHHVFIVEETIPQIDPPDNYFINKLSQDAAGGISEDMISRILLLIFGLITGFSIFQISLVQLKKRQRKFALMRSIGGTLGQIRTIMSWEAFYMLLLALPVGVGLGFLVSWLLILLNNVLMQDQVRLAFQPLWLLIGIGITLIASLIGLFLPLRQLEQIPLRGQIQVIDKKVSKKTRDILGEQVIQRQNIHSINQRHHRFIRKQRLISTLLYSLILFILLGSLWLIYLSFQEYRTQVLDADMPDFELTRGYQQSISMDRDFRMEMGEVERINRTDFFVKGEKAFLWYDRVSENQLLNYWLDMLPAVVDYDYYSTTTDYVLAKEDQYLTKEAMVVDIFGIDTASDYAKRFQSVLPKDFDWERFEQGEMVILLSPGYSLTKEPSEVSLDTALRFNRSERMHQLLKETKSGMLSYDPRRESVLDHEMSFDGLKNVTLTIPTGQLSGMDQIPLNTVNVFSIDVGTVLHHLPREGMWPLSSSHQNPVVLMSHRKITSIYPNRLHQMMGFQYSSVFQSHRSERYANTLYHFYLPKPSAEEALEVKRIGLRYDFVVNNLYLMKADLFAKGLQTSLIVGLLGAALLIVALQIQTTSAQGLLETERNRIGILQSIGVLRKEYSRSYLLDSMKRIAISIGLTHLLLLLIVSAYILISQPGRDLLLEMRINLNDYPYLIHGLITLGFFALGTLAAYWPLGNILQRQPVANIRSLN